MNQGMKHAPILSPDDESDEALSRFLTSLPPPRGVPTTEEEVRAADARALADFAAGRFYPHGLVKQWLADRSSSMPFKERVAQRDG